MSPGCCTRCKEAFDRASAIKLCAPCRSELIGRLGTTRDADLAREFGLSRERIRQFRFLSRIPKVGAVPQGAHALAMALLRETTKSTRGIAAETGASSSGVLRLAHRLGLDMRKRAQAQRVDTWHEGSWKRARLIELWRSGAPMSVIGREVGISALTVSARISRIRAERSGIQLLPYRRSRGRATCSACAGAPPARRPWSLCDPCRVALRALLVAPRPRELSYSALARRFGVSLSAIQRYAHRYPLGSGWGGSTKILDRGEEVIYKEDDAEESPGGKAQARVRR